MEGCGGVGGVAGERCSGGGDATLKFDYRNE